MSLSSKNIVIADSTQLVCFALKQQLTELGQHVVGEASTSDQAVALLLEHQPDIAILEYSLGNATALDIYQNVIAKTPKTQFVLLTDVSNVRALHQACCQMPFAAVLHKADNPSLAALLQALEQQEVMISPSIINQVIPYQRLTHALNDLQHEILHLKSIGLPNEAIAEKLDINLRTASRYYQRVCQILGDDKLQQYQKFVV